MSENVVEIVTFKLFDHVKEDEFTQANDAMLSFLKNQKGFLYRSLAKNEQTKEWTDIVYWENQMNAEAAGKAFMESESTKAMLKFINNNTVNMQHLPVKWQFYPEMELTDMPQPIQQAAS